MNAKTEKLVVHMIGNAHLDPVWMWSWSDGVDEAIATCRTACDLLDEYPELQITRGEAWVYYQIHRIAPKLFKRIATHLKAGRWHVVNGWWVQPDCNLPLAESFLKQSEIGGRFFKEHLGVEATIGYNVDSFGHCAMLPTFLRQGGKNAYLYTRPGAHEMELPANLFRWRSPAGDEVLAFRAASYAAEGQMLIGGLEREIARVSPGIGHTVCMYGTGDHGGGPTRRTIEWIKSHQHYTENVELRFSNLRTFFDAVEHLREKLPVVEGELNPHAVGCYSVVRPLKRESRRAESLLVQAEQLTTTNASLQNKALGRQFELAWRTLLFNQFHDILCGSSIAPACRDALDELGGVKHFARDFLVRATRQLNQALPPCSRQRVVIYNPGARPWTGHLEYEPWLWTVGDRAKYFTLLDDSGACVPTQDLIPEAASDQMRRILFPVDLPPGGRKVFELRRLLTQKRGASSNISVAGQVLGNGRLTATCSRLGVEQIECGGRNLLGVAGIKLVVVTDRTDTWSHGVSSFDGEQVGEFSASEPWAPLENGPLRGELVNTFAAPDATLRWSVSVADEGTVLRMRLRLHWQGGEKLVRMLIPPGFTVGARRDGTPGTILKRPLDGNEYPFMDILAIEGNGQCLTVVSPDIYSASVTPDGVARLTLLRSPLYANEGGSYLPPHNAYQSTDQGVHEFEIALMASAAFDEESALNEAYRLNAPPLISETTFGMPPGGESGLKLPKRNVIPNSPDDAWLPGELVAFAEDPHELAIIPGGKLCRDERLLTCPGDVRLKLPMQEKLTHRLSVACLVGGEYGRLELRVADRVLGVIRGKGKRAMPGLVDFKVEPDAASGSLDLEMRRLGGSMTAIAFVQLIPAYQDIRANDWLVAGPFLVADASGWSGNRNDGSAAMEELIFPPERNHHLEHIENGEPMWRPLNGNDDYIDFHAHSRRLSGSVHYAVTEIKSSRRQTLRVLFGMDYWIKIWINGKLAQGCLCGEGSPVKGKFQAEVHFEEGMNELLVKLVSGSTGNGFWMAVPDDGSLDILTRKKL